MPPVHSPGTARPNVTFPVDEVALAQNPVWSQPLMENLGRRFKRKILFLPEAESLVINAAADEAIRCFVQSGDQLDSEIQARILREAVDRTHPLVDSVHIAFADHRPLRLAPDDIWLVIAQGFSHHVTENAETLRSRLVRHQGQAELRADIAELTLQSFEAAIDSFSAQIRDRTDPVLHETLLCDFTTTTRQTRVASEVAIMDTFSGYFQYVVGCVCGIPSITIEGSPDDWRRIRARVEVLATYGLEWWISRVRPILDEFVHTAEGQPSPDFWKAIYKPRRAYATEAVGGWIADLFPYLADKPHRRKNHILDQPREDWVLASRTGVAPSSFPNGLSSVPIQLEVRGRRHALDLVAGFLSVKQDLPELTISPVVGWCVAEPPPATPIRLRV